MKTDHTALDAQVDWTLCWSHMPEIKFSYIVAQMFNMI